MRNYTKDINIRIQPSEKEIITAYARTLGKTPGKLMRELALAAAAEAGFQTIVDGL